MKNVFYLLRGQGNALCNRAAVAGLALFTLAGCGRDDVKVYQVAKEQPSLTWKTPDGWTEIKPGEMRVASFNVKGQDGKQADVSVIPLPGLAGGDAPNVNRWRGQVGLPPLSPEELAKASEAVVIGGLAANLYDVAGTNPSSGDATRILGVIQHRDEMAWFFKMTGDDVVVAQQKPAFIEFLKSFNNAAAAPGASAMATELPPSHPPIGDMAASASALPAASSGEGKPQWTVPAGWMEIPGGQFLVAKFTIAGEGDAKAAVNVSSSAGEGGGLLGNVNRWRGQLGLKPLTEADLVHEVTEMEAGGGKASLLDFSGSSAQTGQPARLVGAIVPQAGQTWFYKLMGDAKVVESQKAAFTQFVQGVKY